MSNLRLCYLNRADSATLTVSPAADSDAPVTYLQQDGRGYVMRVTSTGPVISGEWGGTSYTISCCSLYRHNLVTNDTWRLVLYPNADWTGTPLYDSGAIDVYDDNLFDDWQYGFSRMWFTAVSAKSFKLTLSSPANPDGYIEAARLVLGPYTEAPYNPRYGIQLGWDDNGEHKRTGGATLATRVGEQWRTMAWDMFVRDEADRAAWLEIGRALSQTGGSVLVDVFPGVGGTQERDYTLLGKFTDSPTQKFSNFNMHDFRVVMEEV